MVEIHELLYQVRLADQIITQLFEKQLGISLTRYQILQFLLQKSPCNQIAVQEKLEIDQAALTRHFKILESEGYVSRNRNPINQREVLVELTQEAKNQLLINPPQHHLKVKEQMESILSTAEQKELTTLLMKLVSGLEKIEF
ncbi:MarR family winged helix-turn-helix transcriptional regulator [Streptococcus infantis]|uniref:MarR family winged helix-turn-helix transcriptional regulator n=1 Tax=Streptococcus infantis TaxID=68892 RepID=UPI001CBB7587|nr:MarR family winged helix-turn-helix transcriptional regulator [Streptococcus infantis]MBZ2109932.1 MarR family winged helix-turn-helix transcriptional regulator [Streptococcus infantis]MBZ2111780.1 MarR family winged helix-turn-helix transcriptional regulator [Streptococcus infantis]MBZ2117490.1 MarR family winged helix-turn-helix transcriptional regulator [Streptococcus infantis]